MTYSFIDLGERSELSSLLSLCYNRHMLIAFLFTLAAGSATILGAFASLHPALIKRPAMAVALGFAAGAMLFVSFAEMIPMSLIELQKEHGSNADFITYGSFFAGLLLMLVVDKLLPNRVNPSDLEGRENKHDSGLKRWEIKKLRRGGILIAIAIGLHNFPEGLVTYIGALENPALGAGLAIAIAIHNIPEGIAIAAPLRAATGNNKKAFTYAALSGLAEPLGALLGIWLLGGVLSATTLGIVLANVGGIMVFICLDELLPAARRYSTGDHQAIYGTIAGMAVMALSLILFTHSQL